MTDIAQKESRLRELLRGYHTLAVAYSGGVDSALLAAVAHEELGDRARLVLADSASIPRAEVREAVELAEKRGWPLTLVTTREFEDPRYLQNDGRRCYFCKTALFTAMREFATANQIAVMAYGAMADDLLDHRPGHQAAREFHVTAPLQEVGLGKDEIRALSAARGLPTASKASFACLSSRFPTGTAIDRATLARVEAAEDVLRERGYRQFRARHHGDVCRIELDPADFPRLLDPAERTALLEGVRAAGYRFVTLDLAGYRMGSVAAPAT